MKSKRSEITCRQIGSASRILIVLNESTIAISGQGGGKRGTFAREEETPPSLWEQLTRHVEDLEPVEVQMPPQSRDRSPAGYFRISIQTDEGVEEFGPFSSATIPEKLRPLFETILTAQSPLQEVVYTENGMSESLKICIQRHQTKIRGNDPAFENQNEEVATPADFWESLCLAVDEIKLNDVSSLTAPSDKRAADMSLYAGLKIQYGGEWSKSSDFDDDNPPEELSPLVALMRSARTGTFRYRGT